jgi:protease-4
MAIFFNIFLRTFAYIFSTIVIFVLAVSAFSIIFDKNTDSFSYISGDKNSSNTIAIIEINGLIIENNRSLSRITNPLSISPMEVKNYLDDLNEISPKIVIFSVNSPGGTVSASKNLYDVIGKYKNSNPKTQIIFHTNELLASGGYWASMSADKIYANYGSIIGSIGVKGPDWFFYDQPKLISTGIFGNTIETKKSVKIYSRTAGESKDIFNPFRMPSEKELDHLQNMVDEIYEDFLMTISKKRKIEKENLMDEIGALIYTSKQAVKLNLIDGELSLNDLVDKIAKESNIENYKIVKKFKYQNSFLKEILTNRFFKVTANKSFECLRLKSSISSVLSYKSTGC